MIIEIESGGPWPVNSIHDINSARIELEEKGWFSNYCLVGSTEHLKPLDFQIGSASTTYRAFMLKHNLVDGIIEQKFSANHVILLAYSINFVHGFDVKLSKLRIKINNIKIQYPAAPSKLTDDELLAKIEQPYAQLGIIREVAKRVFQSLSEKAKKDE